MPIQKPVSHLTTALRSVDVQCTLSDPSRAALLLTLILGGLHSPRPRYIPNRTRKTEQRKIILSSASRGDWGFHLIDQDRSEHKSFG